MQCIQGTNKKVVDYKQLHRKIPEKHYSKKWKHTQLMHQIQSKIDNIGETETKSLKKKPG